MCSSRPATKTTQLFWSKREAGVYHKPPSNPVCVCVFAQRWRVALAGNHKHSNSELRAEIVLEWPPRAWWLVRLLKIQGPGESGHVFLPPQGTWRGANIWEHLLLARHGAQVLHILLCWFHSTTLWSRYYAFTIPDSCPSVSASRMQKRP